MCATVSFYMNRMIVDDVLLTFPVSPFTAQACVNESRFKEQVLYLGQQPPYQLNCPLPVQPQSSPQVQLTWQKDCQQIHSQEGKTYLEFASLSLEDQGNYTCIQQGNNTASFTVRLIIKG